MHSLTLMLAGLLVAALMGDQAVERYTETQVAKNEMTTKQAAKSAGTISHCHGPARLAAAFGATAGGIGILIALASIIGQCLLGIPGGSGDRRSAAPTDGSKTSPRSTRCEFVCAGNPGLF